MGHVLQTGYFRTLSYEKNGGSNATPLGARRICPSTAKRVPGPCIGSRRDFTSGEGSFLKGRVEIMWTGKNKNVQTPHLPSRTSKCKHRKLALWGSTRNWSLPKRKGTKRKPPARRGEQLVVAGPGRGESFGSKAVLKPDTL